jgi:hypothetical protein
MFPLEPLFCPCCTPAILHTLAYSDLACIPQQMLLLGTGALSTFIRQYQQSPASQAISIANSMPPDVLTADRAVMQLNSQE